jgi:hypothetical protein
MPTVTKIRAAILTGNQDPGKNTRIFLGFGGRGGREFRLRIGNDANPYRENQQWELRFGVDHLVKNSELNDPATPYALNSDDIDFAYIRVSPQSTESWLIESVEVELFSGDLGQTLVKKYELHDSITLQEDAGEIVYLESS